MRSSLPRRRCLNCSRWFKPAKHYQVYCQTLCTRAARRVRDREAKQGIGKAPRDPWLDQGPNHLKRDEGRCLRCKRYRALRFDYYGSCTDAALEVRAVFCTADCLIRWWRAQESGPTPDDVDAGLLALIYPDRVQDSEEHWDDYDLDEGDLDEDEADQATDLPVFGAHHPYR